ncbi:Uncharacterised protein [Legionella lansingensis]|uniref:Uncharacterized protein n=1 Tax=Legionella lansingensis TaxID=45067 RepID=A0A0W0VT89_9GAMM|nr:hypothetical protein [Legionella lansingensis]KTD22870.1 hypothetical protein Llan_0987 [Legionella lansingensis]SNV53704.1 Uncharacterised protein [Legionella lansingensis]
MKNIKSISHSRKKDTVEESEANEAIQQLVEEGKKFILGMYEEGREKLQELEAEIKEYSQKTSLFVHKKPITSLLITGGAVYLLYKFLKR